MAELPTAPESIPDAVGRPCLGTYQGELGEVRLEALQGEERIPRWRLPFRRKAWVYALVTTPEVILATAVVDLGYASHAFLTAVDLREKRALLDFSALGLPGPLGRVNARFSRGLSASFRTVGGRFSMSSPPTAGDVSVDVELHPLRTHGVGAVRLELRLLHEGAPPALAVVARVPGGGIHVTAKSAALRARGSLRIGSRIIPLEGGVAGLDVSQGTPARDTAWRWAMACGHLGDGRAFACNLVEGFHEGPGENENAAWVHGALHPLGRARFGFGRDDAFGLWRLESETGDFTLGFRPLHVHREERHLGLVRSRFLQLQGFFTGTLRVGGEVLELNGLPGVTEDQTVRW